MKKLSVIFSMLLCAVLLLAGCTQNLSQQETDKPEPTIVVTEEPQDVDSQSVVNPKGTVTDINKVTNEAGGYFIPIPSAWIGKTSYELNEDETYIYHITQDSSEGTINPTILHVGAAYDLEPSNLYMSAEVFMKMDDVKFYNVPVLDFPYVQGSADGNEYEGFISDIPMVLQSVWVIDESKWQKEIDTNDVNEPQGLGIPFAKEDATLNGIQLGTQKDAVLENFLGVDSLENIETFEMGATGETVEEYVFDFGTLSFTDGIFTGATIHSKAVGPRGFGIGDSIDDIIESFCYAVELVEDGYTIYYRGNEGGDNRSAIVPPSCVLYNKDGIKELDLVCFEDPNILEEAGMEYLRDNYMFEVQYACVFGYDENGIVNTIMLYYGALAE